MRNIDHLSNLSILEMTSLIDQVRTAVEKGQEAERQLASMGHSLTQTAQLAYSLNCVWLYANSDGQPSKDTLAKAIPPIYDGTSESAAKLIDYTRRTMLLVRALMSEKIEEAFRANKDLSEIKTMLGESLQKEDELVEAVPQLVEEDVEEIVEAFVPLSLRPRTSSSSSSDSSTKKKKKTTKSKPWLLT